MSDDKPPVNHLGFLIPHALAWRTGRLEDFSKISAAHVDLLDRYANLAQARNVVEIGCGVGRDAIALLQRLPPDGTYLGIDVMAPSIDWATGAITAKNPNFRFVHFDVADLQHNPGGRTAMTDQTIPAEDDSTDLIFLYSVFTHMFPADVARYLGEFARILRPGGRVLASMFLVDDPLRAHLRQIGGGGMRNLMFAHEVEPGFYHNDPKVVPGATAYAVPRLTEMAEVAGLSVAKVARGTWSRNPPAEIQGQDLVILIPA